MPTTHYVSQQRSLKLNLAAKLSAFDICRLTSKRELLKEEHGILDRFGAENITWALSECLLGDGPRVIVTPGGKDALMAALYKRDGQTIWTTEPLAGEKTSHSSPILFGWAGCRLIASCSSASGFGVDADTGKLLWTVPLKNPHCVNAAR